MNYTYLTTEALAERIHYDVRTIRDRLKDSVLLEGRHYFRPFGGRKILYIWETIERDMKQPALEIDSVTPGTSGLPRDTKARTTQPGAAASTGIPMAGGGVCNG
ncbi:hypothetical protein ACS8Y6_17800 [Salinisphaera sp. RV14]|uniref:hypothetical protein n=1 Tax=Salinisphaera sp. RV14 TaxID=3454140 RepID=UPI003F87277A